MVLENYLFGLSIFFPPALPCLIQNSDYINGKGGQQLAALQQRWRILNQLEENTLQLSNCKRDHE
jgi:hypothetical protein